MAQDRTIAELMTDVRQYADAVDDYGFFTDAEIERRLNESSKRLHTMLSRVMGPAYRVADETLTTTPGQATVDLVDSGNAPLHIETIVHVDWQRSSDERYKIRLGDPDMRLWRERHWYPSHVWYLPRNLARHDANPAYLELYPTPEAAHTILFRYVPGWTDLVDGSGDSVRLPEDWYRWLALDTAIQLGLREKVDVRGLMAERSNITKDIESSAPKTDHAQTYTVQSREPDAYDYGDYLDDDGRGVTW